MEHKVDNFINSHFTDQLDRGLRAARRRWYILGESNRTIETCSEVWAGRAKTRDNLELYTD